MSITVTEDISLRKVRLKRLNKSFGGTYQAIVDANGKAHAYLNAAIPTNQKGQEIAPLYTAICEVCNHAYSHLIGSGTVCCRECHSDAGAIHALNVQDECGIDLGWSACDLISRRDRMEKGTLHIH